MPDGKSEIPADILETTNKLVNHYVNPYEPRTDCRPDFRPYLRKLIAEALAAERQREQWQPIETAPVGQDILLYFPAEPKRYLGEMVTVGRYPVHIPRQPSHWHRLPPKPHHFNQEGK